MNTNTAMQHIENPFTFSEVEVRTAIDAQGEALFCAKDVCQSLDIKWAGRGNTLKSIPDEWVMVSYHETIKGVKEIIFLNEAAVYKMIFRSNKPKAVEFANWVCSEVLPTIRKQGFFGELPAHQRLNYSRQLLNLSKELVRTKDAMICNLLMGEIRDLCNLLGRPMPDIDLIGKEPQQMPLV